MAKYLCPLLIVVVMTTWAGTGLAEESDTPQAIVDKAIAALGDVEKLRQAKAVRWSIFAQAQDGSFQSKVSITMQDLDHARVYFDEFQAEADDSTDAVTVYGGDRAWSLDYTDPKVDELRPADSRSGFLRWMLPVILLPLKDPAFKLELAGSENIDGKPAVGLKVTDRDGQNFTLFFDRESGRPVKQMRNYVYELTLDGKFPNVKTKFSRTVERIYSRYEEVEGLMIAKQIVQRDRESSEQPQPHAGGAVYKLTEFALLKEVDAGTFAEPSVEGSVSGKVAFRGAPVEEGSISFYAPTKRGLNRFDGFPMAEAKLGTGGSYRFDGQFPIGSYKVVVTANKKVDRPSEYKRFVRDGHNNFDIDLDER
jgi:hypothetical protein